MKLSKADIKHLRNVAAQLPVCYTTQDQTTSRYVSGEELLINGVDKVKGQKVKVDETYIHKSNGGVQVNHFRRLKKLCEQDKFVEAQNYINEVANMGKEHINLLKHFSNKITI